MTTSDPESPAAVRRPLWVLAVLALALVAVACGEDEPSGSVVQGEPTETVEPNGGEEDPANGGEEDPANGGEEDPANGGEEDPANGGEGDAGGDEEACGSEVTTVEFDPANFVDPTLDTNPFHPLKPGTQWVRGGSTLVGDREVPHQIITTITDVIRMIDGVPTVAMLDESTDSGEVSQVGMDYLALDTDGNVWILGGYTEEFEGGEYTNTEDAWLGTEGGQTIGILAPAEVTADTPRWCIGGSAEDDPTVGEPVQIDVSECVEFGCYDGVRVVQEGEVGAPDNEHKYYAPGVGVIRNVPLNASLHQDRFELLNFVELTPDGLAEASQTALDLETHARETASDVYGSTPESRRLDE